MGEWSEEESAAWQWSLEQWRAAPRSSDTPDRRSRHDNQQGEEELSEIRRQRDLDSRVIQAVRLWSPEQRRSRASRLQQEMADARRGKRCGHNLSACRTLRAGGERRPPVSPGEVSAALASACLSRGTKQQRALSCLWLSPARHTSGSESARGRGCLGLSPESQAVSVFQSLGWQSSALLRSLCGVKA
jgi:hypothetical protein